MLDLNQITPDEGNDFALIPHGTIARVIMHIKPQMDGVSIPDLANDSIFRQSATTSAKWIECEFNIIGGQFDKRKVWHNIFFDGDKKNPSGVSMSREIGLQSLRKIVDSAKGLAPSDMSPEANTKRQISGLEALNGMEFCIKVAVEKGTNGYDDKNKMLSPVTVNQEGYIGGGNAPQAQAPSQPSSPIQPQGQQQHSGVKPSWA
tara:strand:+ start:674 stop:1285 length:612 start_codon:yes stop_codon:yes gene_type:complete